MFRPEKMSFVNISVLDDYMTQVLDNLAKLGVMHVVDKKEVPVNLDEVMEDIEVEPIRNRLDTLNSKIEDILNILSIPSDTYSISRINPDKIEIDPFQIADRIAEDISEVESEINPIISRRIQLHDEISILEERSHKFASLEAGDISIEDIKNFQFLFFVFGDIPSEHYERLSNSLENSRAVLVTGEEMVGRQQILAFSLMTDKGELSNALEAAYFSKTNIPEGYKGSIEEMLDQIELEIWTYREEMAEIRGRIRSLREKWQEKLQEIHATIIANQIVIDSMEKFGKQDRSYFLSGWVPYSDVSKLQKAIQKISDQGILINATEPVSAEEAQKYISKVPTKLKHPFFLRPFTSLITNFGIPGYSDIDPTPLASLAFLAMFGIMFADVGHGGVLLLAGLFGMFYPHPQLRSVRNLASFLACCGLASMIFGFVFGSVFGKEDWIKPLWFSLEHMNPDAVNRMLMLGVFFGIGMLSLGVFLNIVQSFRRRNYKEALCGRWGIFSLIFYWTALFLLLTNREFTWYRILIVVLLLSPVLLKEPLASLFRRKKVNRVDIRAEEEEGESIIESGFEIYELLMSYLAHTLSYIRMAAFNLSHAGLMMASYALTRELGGDSSFLLSLPSNIIANAFVILLEGLIVAIQCMRLEYYEFFSKFFSGEGIEYKPLKIS
ncbi:hypothetical protein GF312_08280 [Candidatus Poribacteria bacterium]|nr:hypothetical protein [Candidatus Poribacteria bacterium]